MALCCLQGPSAASPCLMASMYAAPTATGESQLDIFHVLGPVKRLQNKPALAFNGTDGFLRVMLAEKEGLITIANEASICSPCYPLWRLETVPWAAPGSLSTLCWGPELCCCCPSCAPLDDMGIWRIGNHLILSLCQCCGQVDNMEQLFVQPMLEYYESSAVSAVSREWNELRQKILRDAVQRLVPQLQQEASSRLLTDARDAVVEQYAERLWKYASQPPVQVVCHPVVTLQAVHAIDELKADNKSGCCAADEV